MHEDIKLRSETRVAHTVTMEIETSSRNANFSMTLTDDFKIILGMMLLNMVKMVLMSHLMTSENLG